MSDRFHLAANLTYASGRGGSCRVTTYEKTGCAEFLADEGGPTAVEYAVMLALILLAIIGVIGTVGSTSADWWQKDADAIVNATGHAEG